MKTKQIKKVLCLALATLTTVGAMAGCGTKRVDSDSDQTLEIYICAQGRGDEWLYTSVENFANSAYVKEKYPNFAYDITSNSESNFAETQIATGNTKYDVLTLVTGLSKVAAMGGRNGNASILENINDVFDSKIPLFNGNGYEKNAAGEEWTVKEKLEAENPINVKYAGKSDDEGNTNYYYLPNMSSAYGIVYNRTKMLQHGFVTADANGEIQGLPRTTKELKTFAETIATSGKAGIEAAFATSDEDGYWMRVQNVWWIQYDGEEAFEKFFEGKKLGDNGRWSVDIDVLDSRGRLLANQTTESYLSLNNSPTLCHTSSASLSYTDTQAYLLQGKVMMVATGDWADYEMRSIVESAKEPMELGMMVTPMLSEVIEVVPEKSIADDEELSALVGAIRAGSTELSGTFEGKAYDVAQADFDYIKSYDGIYAGGELIPSWTIPSYSPAKDLAKDFLRYIATDDFCYEYTKATWGASTGFYYDASVKAPELYAQFSTLQYDRLAYQKGRRSYMPYKSIHNPLVYLGGFNLFAEPLEGVFVADNPADRKTAAEYLASQKAYYAANNNRNWNALFENSGLR